MTGFTLTKKQAECLAFVDERINKTGRAPSFDEVAAALKLKSKSNVHRLYIALEQRGRIRRIPGVARGIEVVDQSRDQLRFLAPDVRRWVILRAQMSNKLPETWLSMEMRKVMDREMAQGAIAGAVIVAGQAKDARSGRVA
jgi:SOS-response transcriptional repressor LexA